MTFPSVTVLMPVYNGDKYIARAIESILNQTFEDYEFLIINDGSSDKTEKIILNYHDSRIVYKKHTQNCGLIYTLNEGIELANGTYIARMDADDVSASTRLKKQLAYIETNAAIDILGTWFAFMDTGIKVCHPINHDECKVKLLKDTVIGHPTVFFRKDSIVKKGLRYDPSSLHAEDYHLWTDCAIKGLKFANLPEVLLEYRIHPEQISTSQNVIQSATTNRIRLYYGRHFFKHIIEGKDDIYLELLNCTINNYQIYHKARNLVKEILNYNKEKQLLNQKHLFELFEFNLNKGAYKIYGSFNKFSFNFILMTIMDKRFYNGLTFSEKIKFFLKMILGESMWMKSRAIIKE